MYASRSDDIEERVYSTEEDVPEVMKSRKVSSISVLLHQWRTSVPPSPKGKVKICCYSPKVSYFMLLLGRLQLRLRTLLSTQSLYYRQTRDSEEAFIHLCLCSFLKFHELVSFGSTGRGLRMFSEDVSLWKRILKIELVNFSLRMQVTSLLPQQGATHRNGEFCII